MLKVLHFVDQSISHNLHCKKNTIFHLINDIFNFILVQIKETSFVIQKLSTKHTFLNQKRDAAVSNLIYIMLEWLVWLAIIYNYCLHQIGYRNNISKIKKGKIWLLLYSKICQAWSVCYQIHFVSTWLESRPVSFITLNMMCIFSYLNHVIKLIDI